MKKNIIGIFTNRRDAEKFINYVHTKLSVPNDEISFIYRNEKGEKKEVDASEISSVNTKEGAKKGAGVGAVIGALGGLATVAGFIPIIGPLFVAGPLVTALGITGGIGATAAGAATGAAVGSLVGALSGMGVGEAKAQQYEDSVIAGNILVAVHSDKTDEIRDEMKRHGATETDVYEVVV